MLAVRHGSCDLGGNCGLGGSWGLGCSEGEGGNQHARVHHSERDDTLGLKITVLMKSYSAAGVVAVCCWRSYKEN